MKNFSSKIIGSGSCIPSLVRGNDAFLSNTFFGKDYELIPKTNEAITQKFAEVAGIVERRCAEKGVKMSDLAVTACERAIEDAGIDAETLDYVIVAHNFGDIEQDSLYTDLLPNLAAKVKHGLKIKNSRCVAYDILFGCPGWVQAFIQAHYFLKSGDVNRILVVGADTVSRATDPHDIDGMLFSDGAGAVILERMELETNQEAGVLAHAAISDCMDEANFLKMGESYSKETEGLFIKMNGKGVFRYAVEKVPQAISDCLNKAGLGLEDVDKFVMHQANMKMNRIILRRLYNLYGHQDFPAEIMPLVVDKLGNSSVATAPTVWDMVMKGQLEGQSINKGDVIVFASVGAGMHANCIVYKHV